ncbi:MAG: OsmC family protein [Acholeplasmataceae bacterium]
MGYDTIKLNYDYDFKGEIITPTAKANLGDAENGLRPYHMLFGALGSCFYATFLSVAKKMRLTFDEASIEVSGYKSDPSLKILDQVEMKLVVVNPSDQDRLLKSAKLGAEYCSIHALVEKAAHIELKVEFK